MGFGQGTEVPDSLINSFALVGYLPEGLARFVEAERREIRTLEPYSADEVRAHVTVLPPRPLACLAEKAAYEVESAGGQLAPFVVELSEVKIFPRSDVIYLSVGQGARELSELHERLSCGKLRFLEYFEYHPHVTLAQFVPRADIARAAEKAARQWQDYPGPRSFLLDRVTLVQNTRKNQWRNLQEFQLGAQVTV